MHNIHFHLACRFLASHIPGVARRLRPLKLTVAATYQCNHRCRICQVWRAAREAPSPARAEMTPDDYARVFHELKDSLLFLDWGGGEPFMRSDTAAIIRLAARICPKLSTYVISTNGWLTDRIAATVEEMAAALPRHRIAVGVSLDGIEEKHDFMRGVPGAFRAATATAARLRQLAKRLPNLEVKLSYTLSSHNAGEFAAFHETVLKPLGLGVGDVGFNLEHTGHLFHTDAAETTTAAARSGDAHRAAIQRDVQYALAEMRRERQPAPPRMKNACRAYFLRNIPGYLASPKTLILPCQATRNSLFLDPHGRFFPCIIWGKLLGHCRDGVASILDSPATAAARKTIDRRQCPVCWNACEMIPSLLTSPRLLRCLAAEFARFPPFRGQPLNLEF